MASEDLKFFFQVPDVKEFTEMVTRSCQQPVAIEIQFHLHHCVFVSMSASREKQKQTVCPETDFSDTDKMCHLPAINIQVNNKAVQATKAEHWGFLCFDPGLLYCKATGSTH